MLKLYLVEVATLDLCTHLSYWSLGSQYNDNLSITNNLTACYQVIVLVTLLKLRGLVTDDKIMGMYFWFCKLGRQHYFFIYRCLFISIFNFVHEVTIVVYIIYYRL